MNFKKVQSMVMDKVSSIDVDAKGLKNAAGSLDGKLPVKVLTKNDVQREQLILIAASIVAVGIVAGASFTLLKKCNCSRKCNCACGSRKKKYSRDRKNLNPYKHHTEHKY